MPQCKGITYKVKDGDTIVSISKKYGVKLADLIKINTHIYNPTQLTAGDEICIPVNKEINKINQVLENQDFGVKLPNGYIISKFVGNLTFPTGITFNDVGEIFVLESGFRAGSVVSPPRILKVNPDGSTSVIAQGFAAPVLGITWHKGYFYVSESGYPGQITRVAMDGTKEVVIKDLPTGGDHGLGDVIFDNEGKMYFGVGTATNSGVVGPDNAWLLKRPKYRDFTCRNIELVGQNFVSDNPITPEPEDRATTGAFLPFANPGKADEIVQRKFPCSGAIYQANSDGTGIRVFADGFRNPFGLAFGPGGNLFATDNGMDARGSRPVDNAFDTLEQVFFGEWYGWPDYNARIPITDSRFKPADGPQPQFLIKNHPPLADLPVATFKPHSVPTKFDFSSSERFGYAGEFFVPLFGVIYHNGKPLSEPSGFKIVRVTPSTGDVADFMVIIDPGAETLGPVHPIQVKFRPDGKEMYLVDFGLSGDTGRPPERNSGAIWKITK